MARIRRNIIPAAAALGETGASGPAGPAGASATALRARVVTHVAVPC